MVSPPDTSNPINTSRIAPEAALISVFPDWFHQNSITAKALLLGERLVLKALETTAPLATNPLVTRAGEAGCAVLLRYGVVVLFNLTAMEEATFLQSLSAFIKEPADQIVAEQLPLAFGTDAKERLESNVLRLRDSSAERLQIVAEALAKSVVLEFYEEEVSKLFDQIKPFTTAIQSQSARPPKERDLLRYIGGTLLIQQKMLGIVEVGEKPDPVWDHPELNRLYLRLEDEYELRERLLALEQKLSLISKTVETVLDILQTDSSHRVEWYIVILIVVEILLSVYEIWFKA
ncbi:MAG: RMD1 family protein [Cyanobacteria bacterium J06632_22]